ncbi:HIT domain-containing protein [Glaciecola sp. KUL10]|uniref:HIT domain-containing protein n=1 Tax=Glaciecola sp. (strain KUL10) TaxID=2161813 RepID=UPI000D78C5DC|nr:HIT family protein [Glaciecola sp. KUL10]GBL03121.1 HIT hydrolase [Glaciecola sp. KUL10]
MTFKLNQTLEKDSLMVCDLSLSQVRLINDCQYPWFILVPRKSGLREIIDLTEDEQALMWKESALLSRCIKTYFAPDKLNLGMLGNMVSQLHVHHIARFKNDVAWPGPVWGKHKMKAYTPEKHDVLINKIKTMLLT